MLDSRLVRVDDRRVSVGGRLYAASTNAIPDPDPGRAYARLLRISGSPSQYTSLRPEAGAVSGMMNCPDLASLPSDRPAFTNQLRLAVAACLGCFKDSSREHTASGLCCYLAWCAQR